MAVTIDGTTGVSLVQDDVITAAKIAANAVGASELDLTANYAFTGTVTGAGASQMSDLTDYEEGQSQLSFTDSSGNTYTGGYASNSGARHVKYTRIGRLVMCTFRCITNSGGSLTNGLSAGNGLRLNGLPFTANSSLEPGLGPAGYDSTIINHDTNEPTAVAYAIPGTSQIGLKFIRDNDEWTDRQGQDISVVGPGAYQGYRGGGAFFYLI